MLENFEDKARMKFGLPPKHKDKFVLVEESVNKWMFENCSSDSQETMIDKMLYAVNMALVEFQSYSSEMLHETFGDSTKAAEYATTIKSFLKQAGVLFLAAKNVSKPIKDKDVFKVDIEALASNTKMANAYANSVNEKDPNRAFFKEIYDSLCRKVENVGFLLHKAELPTPEIKDRENNVLVAKYP